MGVFLFGKEAMPISTEIERLELDTAAVAETQKRTQLQSTVKDIEQFLFIVAVLGCFRKAL